MKQGFKATIRDVIPILLVITIIISSAWVGIFTLTQDKPVNNPQNNSDSFVSTPQPEPEIVEKAALTEFKSVSVIPGEDFLIDDATPSDAVDLSKILIDSIKTDGFDTIELTLNFKDGLLFTTDNYSAPLGELLKEFYTYAKSQSLSVITVLDIHPLIKSSLANEQDLKNICTVLSDNSFANFSDALLLKNVYILPEDMPEDTPELKLKSVMSMAMRDIYFAVAKANPTLYVGVEVNETEMPKRAIYNIQQWFNGGFCDFVCVYDPYSTESDEISFMTYFEEWRTLLGLEGDIFCKLAYDKIGSNEDGWKQTDQILRQLKALDTLDVKGFTLDGWHDFLNDKTESRDVIKKYFSHLLTDSYILRELSVSKPTKKTFTTSESTVLLSGASDPEFKLTLNGEVLKRTVLGYFSTDLELKDGLNTFVIEHKGVSETYKITYKRTVITEISPTKKQTLPSQSILLVSCVAISGGTVTAKLGNTTVTLSEEPIIDESGNKKGDYSNYTGRISLPLVYDEDLSLGKVTFTAKSKYGNATKTGGNIVVIKEERPLPPSSSETSSSGTASNAPTGGEAWKMPSGGMYVNVGNKYIAEVVNWQAETFSSTDNSDYSRPTNNYLPKGTVDYCSSGVVASSGGSMKIMRYGNMLYTKSSKGVQVLNVYQGTLPDHNTIGVSNVSNTGRHTLITLDTLFKAPFRVDIKPQKYTSEKANNRDYTIASATFDHIDITFCYTTLVDGSVIIPESDPVFKKAEWIKNEGDYTLRLHLRKTGMFFGWSAEYNDKGQLVFSFLNPAVITVDNSNLYGYRLDGVVVAIDVGHGGDDGGASGSNPEFEGASGSNPEFNESKLNLILAQKLKAQLESIGAKVYMTRYDNKTNPTSEQRMKLLRDVKADYCIAIHRNASDSSSPRAFNSYHFNSFSANAAKRVNDAIYSYTSEELNEIYNSSKPFHGDGKLYKKTKWSGVKWHYFYTARQTDCPVVLTENGFITNADEYSDMIRDDFNSECAKALTQGIVDYFVSVQLTIPKPATPPSSTVQPSEQPSSQITD